MWLKRNLLACNCEGNCSWSTSACMFYIYFYNFLWILLWQRFKRLKRPRPPKDATRAARSAWHDGVIRSRLLHFHRPRAAFVLWKGRASARLSPAEGVELVFMNKYLISCQRPLAWLTGFCFLFVLLTVAPPDDGVMMSPSEPPSSLHRCRN